ncbi:hypothetical protein D9757_009237 [Collybiopsis confluens]|uniref:F-box domain-containing protein n=1 Tax=Collybiopsis confluens TaxID=2823264 RepID=A0A8H5HAK0_9AGAR|nr:hypothetical protein D9757_009237 [Collybiopsis confluens]
MPPLTRARARAPPSNIRTIQEWSTPIRCSDGHTILSIIPAEIYLEIISYLRPDSPLLEYESLHATIVRDRRIRDLFSLSLVCRFLASLVLPLAYQAVFLQPERSTHPNDDSAKRSFLPFCKFLVHGVVNAKLLAPHVRSCVLQDYSFTGIPLTKISGSLLKTHVDALPAMTNVSAFVVARVPITPGLLNNIKRLPQLSSLAFDCCDFSGVEPEQIQRMANKLRSSRRLKSLRFLCRDSRQNYMLFKPDFHKIRELVPLLSDDLTELCTDSWVFMRLVMNAAAPNSNPRYCPPLQTLRLHFVMSLPQLCDYLYERVFNTLTSLLIDVVSCPEPTAGNSDPYTLSLLRLPHLRSLTCPPHMAYHLSGTHDLNELTFNTRLSLSALDEKNFLAQSLSASEKWAKIDQYRGLDELCLPLTYLMEVKGVAGNEGDFPVEGDDKSTVQDWSSSSSSSVMAGSACKAASSVELPLHELQLTKLTVIGDSGTVLGRQDFETRVVEKFSTIWRSPSLKQLRFVDLVFEDFCAPLSMLTPLKPSPILSPIPKAESPSAEDEHKDVVFTRYFLSLLSQQRCFPMLERMSFIGTKPTAARGRTATASGGGTGGGGAGAGVVEGGAGASTSTNATASVRPATAGETSRSCPKDAWWSWSWRKDGGSDGGEWRLVDVQDEFDD